MKLRFHWATLGVMSLLIFGCAASAYHKGNTYGATAAFLAGVGAVLNVIAVKANSGLMPYRWVPDERHIALGLPFTKRKLRICMKKSEDDSPAHCPMSDSTRLYWLCDWIDMGYGIASIGDLFIYAGELMIAAALLKTVCGWMF
jgi:hypothetical protein